eukprot:6178368-Pleurochrysis_carterae.AAC.1
MATVGIVDAQAVSSYSWSPLPDRMSNFGVSEDLLRALPIAQASGMDAGQSVGRSLPLTRAC